MRLKFEFLYRSLRAKQTYISHHTHHCYEIVYYINGNGSTEIGNTKHHFGAGSYCLIRPGTLHDERRIQDTDVIFVGFTCEEDSLELQEGIFQDKNSTILSLLEALYDEYTSKQTHYSIMLDYMIGRLAVELSRQKHELWSMRTGGKKLVTFQRYIDNHFHEKLNLGVMAENFGYSYDRFRHLFKEEFGASPQQYVLMKRIANSCELLVNTDLSVLDISGRSGFSTDAQFCKLFKRETGESPRQYRASRRTLPDELSGSQGETADAVL
ncbi:helix-turn-helix domain-containing protein [Paenibacillus sp. OV219]|uniref:AraC family transcriptional regulator n=1 Tax=Paenibacillus sp. OV219 TaxID=1884377 RepID=UPI0008C43DB0|nr:helix-turn-helix domain-containing protein [Paenibacillus sp. OV219]SEM56818.1 AraC family transcriptional regulator, transcriptional activator of pobA [Paenibacillus sp. OV219]